jgi:hypothetical protein
MLQSAIFSESLAYVLRVSAEAGADIFTDTKTASSMLAILLFLGVNVGMLDGFGSPTAHVGLSTLNCYVVFLISALRPDLY